MLFDSDLTVCFDNIFGILDYGLKFISQNNSLSFDFQSSNSPALRLCEAFVAASNHDGSNRPSIKSSWN
jgi:hypothetical protein